MTVIHFNGFRTLVKEDLTEITTNRSERLNLTGVDKLTLKGEFPVVVYSKNICLVHEYKPGTPDLRTK